MDDSMILGVDIGGSHITATLVNLNTGHLIKNSQVRAAVDARGEANDIISQWSDVISKAFAFHNVTVKRLGIAMPGPFDYDAGIAWMKNQDKYDSLYGLNVKALLSESLDIPKDSIRFLNDAESFLLGEVFSGAAKGTSRAVGLTLGTGLGSARFLNRGVEDANLWCSPFLDATAEDYLSTRWFVKRYFELSEIKVQGVKELASLTNDDNALQTFLEFGNHLGLFLKPVILQDQPETIVLGGNISNAFPLFAASLNKALKDLPNVPAIKKSELGEDACLIGAASNWVNFLSYPSVRA